MGGRTTLVTGGAGVLGSALVRVAPPDRQVEVTIHEHSAAPGVKAHRIDLAQPLAFFELLERRRPSVVIHTAYSRTDHQVTVDSTAEVASACAALETPMIHMSTDALFDGDHAPYRESDDPSPINAYGRAKALAEASVREACPDAAIIRASLILAADGSDGTTSWALDRFRSGERVTLFDDEFRMPIFDDDLAAMIWEIASLEPAERRGVWHLPGAERLSRVELGRILCRRFGLDESLIDVASATSLPEPRPRDLSLVSGRAASLRSEPRSVTTLGAHGQTHPQ